MLQSLKTVDDLLADHQGQLQRLLDLYLSGDFTREFLLDRKSRLEATIAALQSERSSIEERLENQSLTQEEIENIQVFAEEVAEGLSAADEDFDARRQIIEALDVQTTLTVENDEKVAYVRCVFGEDTLLIESNNTCMRKSPGNRRPAPAHQSGHGRRTAPRRYKSVHRRRGPSRPASSPG